MNRTSPQALTLVSFAALSAFAASALAVNPADFVAGVNNPFFPLNPGTIYYYEGSDGNDTMTVTHDTQVIDGVTCIVVRDQFFDLNGALVEDTFDYYAQDTAGNVWYFGEDTEEFDPVTGDVVSTEGTWRSGVDGAEPGIIMLADPKKGDSYQQENAPPAAQDSATVIALNKTVKVAYGKFKNCLQTRESTPLEPGVLEDKYYARGIGVIYTKVVKGGKEKSELVSIVVED